ncbi:hypothetical protein [Reticulibacter mediterranei]|uniref:hypothetical protein n=1 Tax=Reticulibacter mediterranei TaxID=2778369 RepID=UPI001C68C4FA|nr:hypothetical protein [Reticulibacter mediterranei]
MRDVLNTMIPIAKQESGRTALLAGIPNHAYWWREQNNCYVDLTNIIEQSVLSLMQHEMHFRYLHLTFHTRYY